MHSSLGTTSAAPPGHTTAEQKAIQSADRTYQYSTIAAMLVMLATLWLFW